MKLTRCPSCHSHIHLDTLLQDNASKELLATVAKLPASLSTVIVAYIALFRPPKSDLNNARATKLINEILALTDNQTALINALEQTVLAIHAKRQSGTAQPMKNHSYLVKVLTTIIDHHHHPLVKANASIKSGAVVKVQGNQESLEQNQAMFEQTHARYKQGK